MVLIYYMIDYIIVLQRGLNHKEVSGVPGWSEQVKPDGDGSILWHWIWLESSEPQSGIVYDVMKRVEYRYHYAVRCCKE